MSRESPPGTDNGPGSDPEAATNRACPRSRSSDTVRRALDDGQGRDDPLQPCPFYWTPPPQWAGLSPTERAERAAAFARWLRPWRLRVYRRTIAETAWSVACMRRDGDTARPGRMTLADAEEYLADLRREYAALVALDDAARARQARRRRRRPPEPVPAPRVEVDDLTRARRLADLDRARAQAGGANGRP